MKIDLVNKLSRLAFHGYYDPSKNMVTVHFFNDKEDKFDVIAYLLRDMTWDVREVIKESSQLMPDREIIIIEHNCLSVEKPGDAFDDFVRLGLTEMGKAYHGDDVKLTDVDIMFEILENNEYK